MVAIRRHRTAIGVIVGLGLVAVTQRWLAEFRPFPPDLRASRRIVVTSEADEGPGSLREAIFAADRSDQKTRVEIRVSRITLRTPLPPLVNPEGVILDALAAPCEIDARAIPSEPVLDVSSAGSVIHGLGITGASGPGILVRSSGIRLADLAMLDCAEAVTVGESVRDLVVQDSLFESNGIGVRLPPDVSGVALRNNRFRKHEQAAVWAVSPVPRLVTPDDPLLLQDNRFEGDRIAVVLIHVPARVERNEFSESREAAVYLTGAGTIRENRIRGGSSLGIFADAPDGASIDGNEVDHNLAVGILLREARDTLLRGNRVYVNGYGIAIIFGERGTSTVVADNLILNQGEDGLFVLGGSPFLTSNRVLGNRAAGLRVLDFIPLNGPRRFADPFLRDNVLRNNLLDVPVHGEYRATREEEKRR